MTPNNSLPATEVSPLPSVNGVIKPSAIATGAKPEPDHPRDSIREIIETVVFVTILVLLLKSFVAEAFVIPTGSMAETLLGYQKFVECPECKFVFPVNCTDEVEPPNGADARPVEACTCPNCRYHEVWHEGDRWIKQSPNWGSGDRVLVSKGPMRDFSRWDVVVFKYPKEPQQAYVPMNYIKRLIGLPGETIAIFNGDLYLAKEPIEYPPDRCPQPPREADRWNRTYMYESDPAALEAFREGKFEMLRKPPAQILSMRRIVYDNDHQANDLVGVAPPRWQTESPWTANDPTKPTEFRVDADAARDAWVRYQHIAVEHGPGKPPPHAPFPTDYIRNMLGYNMAEPGRGSKEEENKFWVGDLSLDSNVDVTSPTGEFILELSKGADLFQARFDISTGVCRLIRKGPVSDAELARQPTMLRGVGKHELRFANVDDRLTVWVDGSLPFGDGVEYSGVRKGEPDEVNDRQPASIGVHGNTGLTVSHLKLYRDTYYTGSVGGFFGNEPRVATRFIQPGHYLCLGDNSTQSSDGRDWGMVPERLMLGRALLVYFPVWPLGVNRAGPIR